MTGNTIDVETIEKTQAELENEMKQKKEEMKKTCQDLPDYKEKIETTKTSFLSVLKQCNLTIKYFYNINTIDDIKDDSVLYNCCFYFTNLSRYLDKLKKDKVAVMNSILQAIDTKTDLIMTLPDDYSLHLTIPKDNDIYKISIIQEYNKTLQYNAIDLYLATCEENINSNQLLLLLIQLKDIIYLQKKDMVIEWAHLDGRLINVLPLAISLLAIAVLIYSDDFKKKILF